jgi:ferredoxin-NADP reductase
LPRFLPGQFLHLALDDYDPSGFWPESRAFSIASSPKLRNFLRISYSVVGNFTSRMEKELVEGRWIWVKLPYGEFTIKPASTIVLFAGGTGITAFTSFLEDYEVDAPSTIHLFYGARDISLLIYKEHFEKHFSKTRNLLIHYYSEKPIPQTSPNEPINIGKLSVENAWSKIENPCTAEFYIAGPPIMIENISNELIRRCVLPTSIHIDAWV